MPDKDQSSAFKEAIKYTTFLIIGKTVTLINDCAKCSSSFKEFKENLNTLAKVYEQKGGDKNE